MPSVIPGIPYIDPNVDHVGMDRWQEMTAPSLKRLKRTLVVRDGDRPLAVVVPFKTFLRIQREIDRLSNLVEEFEDRQTDPLYFSSFPGFDDAGLPDLVGDPDDDSGVSNEDETAPSTGEGNPD